MTLPLLFAKVSSTLQQAAPRQHVAPGSWRSSSEPGNSSLPFCRPVCGVHALGSHRHSLLASLRSHQRVAAWVGLHG